MSRNTLSVVLRLSLFTVVLLAGGQAALADPQAGTLWGCGHNSYGQLGNGSDDASVKEVVEADIDGVVQAAAGSGHSVILKKDGTVWTCGRNEKGQLGVGDTTERATPVQVLGSGGVGYLTDVVAVAAGYQHSVALKSDGTVWCWGDNYRMQLGDGTDIDRWTPVQVLGLGGSGHLTGMAVVAAGGCSTAALKPDGSAWTWGENLYGELGDGTVTYRSSPVRVVGPGGAGYLANVATLACAEDHMVARKTDGTVWTWGRGLGGRLGNNATVNSHTPVQVVDLSDGSGFLTGVVAVAGGWRHSLAVKSDGTVRAWGENPDGELGDGSTTNRHTAVAVTGLTDARAVAAGLGYSTALRADGTVRAWGYNGNGRLGDGTIINRLTPVEVVGLTNVVAPCAGHAHALYVIGCPAGTVLVTGAGERGQHGDGTWDSSTVATASLMTEAVQVAYGDVHVVALKGDGTVWTWGDNQYGQLGDGTTTDRNTPAQVAGLPVCAAVGSGRMHSLAVAADGSVWAWGNNMVGQLGDGTKTERHSPVRVVGPGGAGYLGGVVVVDGGDYHSVAMKGDGTVWTWGWNYRGQLGDGTWTNSSTPVQVVGIGGSGHLSGVTGISSWENFVLAMGADGTLWGWGSNGNGQLGDGTTDNANTPVVAGGGLTGVVQFAAGSGHALAVKADGTLWAWGYNFCGQLGDGTTTDRHSPVQVTDPSDPSGYLTNVALAAGTGQCSLAILRDGTVRAWGWNDNGQLGDGTATDRLTPVQMVGVTHAVSVGGGYWHSAVLIGSPPGTLWGWGPNTHGQVGDGTTTHRLEPVPVDLEDVCWMASGLEFSTAVCSDGSVWTWGHNVYGQLGDGTTTERSLPGQVPGFSAMATTCGAEHVVALKADGTAWAWGCNNHGQLGDGTTTNRYTPVQVHGPGDVGTMTGVVQASGGGFFTLALRADGTVWAWGHNDSGQLGDGTTSDRYTPVQVVGLTDVVEVAVAGGSHGLALKADGTVWAWGWNNHGQLGDGTTTNRYTPIQVPGLSQVVHISAGFNHSLALKADGTVWTWGLNNYGQLGDGTTTDRPSPVQMLAPGGGVFLSGALAVYGGGWMSRILRADGTAWGCGANGGGQLGDGTTTNRSTLVQTVSLLNVCRLGISGQHDLALVGAEDTHTLAVATSPTDKGTALVLNPKPAYAYGELVTVEVTCESGYSVYYWSGAPAGMQGNTTRITFPMTGDTTITAFIGLDSSPGNVVSWGDNARGQLGDSTWTDRLAPVPVIGATGCHSVGSGSNHILVIREDNTVVACGANDYGQCGNGSTADLGTPCPVSGLTGAYTVAGGRWHSACSDGNTNVKTWGRNHYGQLGNGTWADSLTPVTATGLTGVVSVSAGESNCAALRLDGTVWTWGYNGWGRLGISEAVNRNYPVQVQGPGGVGHLEGIMAVSMGSFHTAALKLDGTVWSWGYNGEGQLGNSSTTFSAAPVQASGLTGVRAIAAGGSHTLALKTDGTVWSWGHNAYGQLGDATTFNRTAPVQVSGLVDIVYIGAGMNHSMAVDAWGMLYTWGRNHEGQLCDGGTTNSSEPNETGCPPGVVKMAGGEGHTLALFGPLSTDTLEVLVDPPGSGTVTVTPDWADYDTQMPVVLEALAEPGYEFSHWSGETNTMIDTSAAQTAIFMFDSWTVTANFVESQEEPLEIAAELDHAWVYQNTAATTQDRHRSRLTVSIVSGEIDGETYVVTVGEGGGGLMDFTTMDTGDPLVIDIVGGGADWSMPSAPGSYTLSVTVDGPMCGQTETVLVPLKLCEIGDISGDGNINAVDKAHMNAWLNGMPLPGDTVRHVDLNGDGNVNAVDKVQINRQLNGLGIL